MDNYLMVCKNLLRSLEVPFIQYFLKEKLLTHPEPESLLSISDILTKYKVNSLALQLSDDKLDQVPLPCVVQINQNRHLFFSCLSQVSADWVEYLDERGKLIKQSRAEFVFKWTGIKLVFVKEENAEEPEYYKRQNEQVTQISTNFSNDYELPSI